MSDHRESPLFVFIFLCMIFSLRQLDTVPMHHYSRRPLHSRVIYTLHYYLHYRHVKVKMLLHSNITDLPYRPKEPVANGNSQGSEVKKTVCQKRALEDSDGTADRLSKNKQKKRSRNPKKNFCPEQKRESDLSPAAQTADLLFETLT